MEGLDRLAELDRLDGAGQGSALRWRWYENEVPGRRINNIWHRPMSTSDKRYIVQTSDSVIDRCILMSTDPGDLIFDPNLWFRHCRPGSGELGPAVDHLRYVHRRGCRCPPTPHDCDVSVLEDQRPRRSWPQPL